MSYDVLLIRPVDLCVLVRVLPQFYVLLSADYETDVGAVETHSMRKAKPRPYRGLALECDDL